MAAPIGSLRVRPVEAIFQKDHSKLTKQNPYIVLSIGPYEYKTSTARFGGTHPCWTEYFFIKDLTSPDMIVTVYDRGHLSKNNLIGRGMFSLSKIFNETIPCDFWIDLFVDGFQVGKARFNFDWRKGDTHGMTECEQSIYDELKMKKKKGSVAKKLQNKLVHSVGKEPAIPDKFEISQGATKQVILTTYTSEVPVIESKESKKRHFLRKVKEKLHKHQRPNTFARSESYPGTNSVFGYDSLASKGTEMHIQRLEGEVQVLPLEVSVIADQKKKDHDYYIIIKNAATQEIAHINTERGEYPSWSKHFRIKDGEELSFSLYEKSILSNTFLIGEGVFEIGCLSSEGRKSECWIVLQKGELMVGKIKLSMSLSLYNNNSGTGLEETQTPEQIYTQNMINAHRAPVVTDEQFAETIDKGEGGLNVVGFY